MYTVGFMFHQCRYVNGIKPVLQDYSWWFDLVESIASQADIFEIRCWPEESEAIATGQRFGRRLENFETKELVFKGLISEAFLKHIYKHGFDDDGALKWFTLSFYKGEELIFESGHYGTEPYVFLKTEEEVQKLEGWSRKYPVISRVDIHR